jgi:hypothetical protein
VWHDLWWFQWAFPEQPLHVFISHFYVIFGEMYTWSIHPFLIVLFVFYYWVVRVLYKLGAVIHVYNPSTGEAESWGLWIWGYIVRPCLKNQKTMTSKNPNSSSKQKPSVRVLLYCRCKPRVRYMTGKQLPFRASHSSPVSILSDY